MNEYILNKMRKGRSLRDTGLRKEIGIFAGAVGIILNLVLAIVKIAIGLFTHSISITADAVNNAFDTASSIITIIGFKLASKPPDKNHPYGHGRIEHIVAMIISLFVIVIGLQFIRFSVDRIRNPHKIHYNTISIIFLVSSIVLKFWFCKFNKFFGESIGSKVLLAVALDSMGDVVTTIITLIPMATIFFTEFPIDGYIGLIVSLMIIYNGWELLGTSLGPLIGEAPPDEILEIIEKEVDKVPGISNIHEVIYENRGGGHSLVVINVEMCAQMTLKEVHYIIDKVERNVENKYNIHLVIHPEPIGHFTKEEEILMNQIRDTLMDYEMIIDYYDFRLIKESKEICLDIEIKLDSGNPDSIKEKICKELQDIPNYEWDVRCFPGV